MEKYFTGIEVTQGSFSLKKVVLTESKSCNVDFIICRISNEDTYIINGSLAPKYMANEELLNALDGLKNQLCKVRNMKVDKHHRVNVKGLKLGGNEDKRKYKILGTELSESDQKMDLDTHDIHFSEKTYGNEKEIEEKCDKIEELVFKYLFDYKNNKAQRTMALDEDTDEGTEDDTPSVEDYQEDENNEIPESNSNEVDFENSQEDTEEE